AGCPACQAEQLRAARVQRLLAAAARTEFPDVRFTPPAVDAAPAPAAKSGGPRLRWLGWAVAAAVVLGVGLPTTLHVTTVVRQQRTLADARRYADELVQEHNALVVSHDAQIAAANETYQKALADAQASETELNRKLQE